jgi:outer membrane protein OmpA-like peptidoglycan-associated protein
MKPHYTKERSRLTFFNILALALVIPLLSNSQTKVPTESNGYVVIGAFNIEKNAKKLSTYAKTKSIKAKYQIHPTKDLFYVYEEVSDPKMERNRIKESFPEFYDVWVYKGALGRNPVEANSENTVTKNSRVISETNQSAHAGIASNKEVSALTNEITETKEEPIRLEKKENIYHLYFNTINSKNMREVKGNVNVIDPVRAKQLLVAKSHEVVEVKDPKNGNGAVKLSTDIFGFREIQQSIDLNNPVNDTTKNFVHVIGDSIIVDFEMQRYNKGDVLVMYNVYFFKDAAIMQPESIYELNSLLDMLKENEKLKVKLHGHTNGNSHGRILHLDPDDKNFFSLNANHKEDSGSAKKLSMFRAYTIQHWLIEQGISPDRMEIKGWGGKQMVFDKHDTQAFKNVRVEVEITED